MQMATFVEALRNDLEGFAAVGDDPASEAARRLTHALRGSAHLRLLDALGEAALEVSAQLPSGHVEVRLSGGDVELVYVEDEQTAAPPAGDDFTARITLRLPEALKQGIEAAAAREGASVNAWIVRALARMLSGGPTVPRVGSRLTGFGRS